MNKKKVFLKIKVLMMIAMLLISFSQPIYAAEPDKQIVKVAYFDIGDYYKEISNGVVDSYDTEKLNKIEKYSNLSFQYVNCGTWANALEMLDRHEVDLVGTVQWTREREEQYEFCLESYGYTIAELAASPGSDFIYEDYDEIGKSVVGCVESYVRMDDVKKLFSSHSISPTIKYYPSQVELENALETGEVNLIAANSHTLKSDYVVVEKFAVGPYFFASFK